MAIRRFLVATIRKIFSGLSTHIALIERGGYERMFRTQMLMVGMLLVAALIAAAPGAFSIQQTAPPAILAVDIKNFVSYQQDFGDATKFAIDPNVPPLPAIRNFQPFVFIADVVAVNDTPVKGTFTARGTNITRTTTLSPGNAIADAAGGPYYDSMIRISALDGTEIGTVMATGWGGSAKAPGSPSSVIQGNFTVTGGTGAFLGVSGQLGAGEVTVAGRSTSVAEDPAYRRTNGGGTRRLIYHLLPRERPEIIRVWHADFIPVTHATPAHIGEVLVLLARGLGPTRPGVEPGASFPTSPVQVVNSPLEIAFGGAPATVINQVGWPGQHDLYRVEFRVPETGAPTAEIQLTVAWIPAPTVTVPVQ